LCPITCPCLLISDWEGSRRTVPLEKILRSMSLLAA
jgi:hypothetical protein